MTEPLDPVVLTEWLAGRLSPTSREALDAWLAADPARRAELDEFRRIWEQAEASAERLASEDEADRAEAARWAAIRRAIGEPARPRTIEFPRSRRPSRVRRWAAAAMIFLALGAGLLWYGVQSVPRIHEFAAALGEPTTVTLSDGSRVTLAAGSRLTFAERASAGPDSRRAVLHGQAFFAVVRHPRRPFSVTAGTVITRVLGTQFSVRAYEGDSIATVVVRSGRVAVIGAGAETRDTGVVLTSGRAAHVDQAGRVRVGAANLQRALAWTTGRLEFSGAELREVLRDVNRWYGLRLRLADPSLAHHRVTLTLDRAEPNEAIATLARLLDAHVEPRGDDIVLNTTKAPQ